MKKQISLTLLIIGSFCITTQAQTTISKNLSLADFIRYEDMFGTQSVDTMLHRTLADVGSWKDETSGKEYALVCLNAAGDSSGVAMVDVTDPGNVFLKKIIRHSDPGTGVNNTPVDVQIYNDIAYVGQDENPVTAYWVNLQTAVGAPANPTAGVFTDGFGVLPTNARIHNMHINVDHELLFMSDFRLNDTIPVFDISNVPSVDPQKVGEIPQLVNNGRHHDMYVRTSGSQGYVFDAAMQAIDVTEYNWNGTFSLSNQRVHAFNPRRGQMPNDFTPPVGRSIHSTWMSQNTDYLFTTVEGHGGDSGFEGTTWLDPDNTEYQRASYLMVWNVSNLDSTVSEIVNDYRYEIKQAYEVRENTSTGDGSFASAYFDTLNGEKANSIHNVHTRADTAYISYYTRGIRVLDLSNLPNMSELAFYDVPGLVEFRSPVLNGAFGVDPFLPSRTILGSSTDGLYVFRPVGQFGGSVGVPTRWTTGITVVDNLSVDSLVTVQGDVTVSFNANMSLSNDIAMTSGSTITLASTDGITTISSADGVQTIGVAGTGGSAKMVAGGGSGGPITPDTEVVISRPGRYHLSQNYPNPFNPVSVIRYELPMESEVLLEVYDILGRRVAVLVSEMKQAGVHQVSWDATNMASGLYIYRLRAGDFIQSRQMMLVK